MADAMDLDESGDDEVQAIEAEAAGSAEAIDLSSSTVEDERARLSNSNEFQNHAALVEIDEAGRRRKRRKRKGETRMEEIGGRDARTESQQLYGADVEEKEELPDVPHSSNVSTGDGIEQSRTVEAVNISQVLEKADLVVTTLIGVSQNSTVNITEAEKHARKNKYAEAVISRETKYSRQRRYFDVQEGFWDACCYCGKTGHAAANCMAKQNRKPCYLCGSFTHMAKRCRQRFDCSFCLKKGHPAENCPEKNSVSSIFCLRCGDSGHYMESCRNGYCSDDLKQICCYMCNNLGHLCCVDYPDKDTIEVSCYNCGQSGHTGLACKQPHGASGLTKSFKCYKCGEKGHFAKDCKNDAKDAQKLAALLTPRQRKRRIKKKGVKKKNVNIGPPVSAAKSQYL